MKLAGVGDWIRRNILGLVAIYIALGGTALGLAGRNAVDSGDIGNRQVKAKDLARKSVRSPTVRNDSLTGADIDESDLDLDPVAFGAPIAGDRIADDSVTGDDVSESTLGKVPDATSADSAAAADTAATINGIERRYIGVSQPSGATSTTVVDRGGIVVTMRCDFDSGITVNVPNTPDSRRMHVFAAIPHDGAGNPLAWTRQEGSFQGGPQSTALGRVVVFRAGGGMSTLDYTYYEVADSFGSSDDCFLRGVYEQAG